MYTNTKFSNNFKKMIRINNGKYKEFQKIAYVVKMMNNK